jgi:hypothetical protein
MTKIAYLTTVAWLRAFAAHAQTNTPPEAAKPAWLPSVRSTLHN